MKACGRVQSFHHPSHKPWFIWTQQLHRPTTLIHWPSRNPGDRGGPEKNGIVRLVIPSTSSRFTSTALYNVYACEEGQKIKTVLAFATLSHYTQPYITEKGVHHFLSSHYQFLSLAFSAFSRLSSSLLFSIRAQNVETRKAASWTAELIVKQRAAFNRSLSARTDPFNRSKAVEEDQVKTMELGSSVRWPAVAVGNGHNNLFWETLSEWQFLKKKKKKVCGEKQGVKDSGKMSSAGFTATISVTWKPWLAAATLATFSWAFGSWAEPEGAGMLELWEDGPRSSGLSRAQSWAGTRATTAL